MQEIPSAPPPPVPCSRLSPRHRHPSRPCEPHHHPPSRPPPTLSPDPPRQLTTLPTSWLPGPPCRARGPAAASPAHLRQLPGLTASAAGEESPPPPSTPGTERGAPPPRCTLGRLRRLPVTPQPQASDRHRLPQQPANCSTTTSPLIDWAHALNNSRSHWLRRGLGPPPPSPTPSVRRRKIPPGSQGKNTASLPFSSSVPPSPVGFRAGKAWDTHAITHYQLPGSSLRSSLPCLGSFAPGPERWYDLLRFPAVRNSGRQRVRFRLAPAGRLNVECLERSDCCQVI